VGRRPAWPEIEDLQGTSRPWDSSSWRRERLQGLPHDLHHQQSRQRAEPEERGGVPHVLERHLGGPPGLMKIFKLR